MTNAFSVALSALLASITSGVLNGQQPGPDGEVVMSYPMFTAQIGPAFRITEVDRAAGKLTLTFEKPGFLLPSEGAQLLILRDQAGTSTHVVPIQVTEITEDGRFLATFRPGAGEALKPGPADLIRPFKGLFDMRNDPNNERPRPVPTGRIQALPDVLPIGPDKPAGKPQTNALQEARLAAMRAQSTNNLKQIMLALFNYESAYGHFPPAVVYGPDGKPWHSWRVLILPFMEQNTVYQAYDFTVPWDHPKNKKVVDTVIKIYTDPIHGADVGPVTHYAAIVGDGALFPPAGFKMNDLQNPLGNLAQGAVTRLRDITDGTSNTIAVAPVDPARKIPWAKPEDIAFGADFPGLGKPGGIAAPYPKSGSDGRLTPVAFGDGSIQTLDSAVDPKTLKALITIRGGEVIDANSYRMPRQVDGPPPTPILRIRKSASGAYSAVIE